MKYLTPEQVAALPDGSSIMVTWSGRGEPHQYTLKKRDGVLLACILTSVGTLNNGFDRVSLPNEATGDNNGS